MGGFGVLLLVLVLTSGSCSCSRHILNMAEAPNPNSATKNESQLSLDKVRQALISQEDTIVFRLIERAVFPLNSPTYHRKFSSSPSLFHFLVKGTEALQSQVIIKPITLQPFIFFSVSSLISLEMFCLSLHLSFGVS